ncbi:MAG: hypothetical protein AAGF12_34610, partial [Myxococcota bacterium]
MRNVGGMCVGVCLLGALIGCDTNEPASAGAFLEACGASSDCAPGLSCQCGVCTSTCNIDSECSQLGAATCVPGLPTECGGSEAALRCDVACVSHTDCPRGLGCQGGRCRATTMDAGIPDAADASVADDGAVESDANVPDSDAGEPDGEAMVSCVPSEWSCIGLDQAGYCNGAGDGFVHTVPCEVGCADGFCDVFRPVGDLCGAIRNGARGELVGGTDCPAILSSLDVGYEYTMWLDAGDEVVVEAEALSPLARAQIHLDHECVAGACATEAVSMPGGTAQARHTAPRSRQIRVRVKAGPGQMIGARVRYEIELIPASVRPTLPPPTCTADQATCPNANRVEYCSGDGQELRAFNCAETPDAVPGTCTAGACDHGPGPSCAHAQPIVRPPSDQLGLGASLNGMFNDIDPGPDCFGIGQSGPDRIWRLAMNAGERIRLRMVSENLGHRIHSLYILRGSCGSPTTSCVAGGLGYRFTDSRGRSRVNPELDYTAPADETIYIVADVEGRVSDDELRTLSIRWTGSCTDGVENGDETDIDCGGSCGGCGDGQMCRVDGDCESRRCGELTAGRCGRPFGCGDGVLGPLEFCDDGNTVDNDFCSNGCRTATCD